MTKESKYTKYLELKDSRSSPKVGISWLCVSNSLNSSTFKKSHPGRGTYVLASSLLLSWQAGTGLIHRQFLQPLSQMHQIPGYDLRATRTMSTCSCQAASPLLYLPWPALVGAQLGGVFPVWSKHNDSSNSSCQNRMEPTGKEISIIAFAKYHLQGKGKQPGERRVQPSLAWALCPPAQH